MGRLLPALLLLALTALLYLPGTGTIPLMDRDEPRFAHATVEMVQRDTWLIPYFNGEYRFDKPPLTYWWMRLHYVLFGVNELAARMHSVVAVWLVSLVVFAMGKRFSGTDAAWWGSVGWLTSFQALVHGRLCVADMPMILFVTLAMWALFKLFGEEATPPRFGRWWWLLWLALGLGFLAKGPIALLVPALALLLWRFALWRKPVPWSRLQMGWGLMITLIPVAAWGIPALIETHGLFWKVGMGEHVVKRGTQSFNGRAIIPGYYLASAFVSLLPWIVFLPQVLSHLRKRWSARYSLLVAWFAAPQLIFLFYATQLPHYTMPGFPAFFLMLGMTLASERARVSMFAASVLGGFTLLALTVLGVTWAGGIKMSGELQIVFTSVAAVLGSLVLLGLAACFRSRITMGAACVVCAVALIPLGRSLRAMHPAVQMASRLHFTSPTPALAAWQFTEPGLVFYADKEWDMLSKLGRVQERINKQRADAVVLLSREWTLSDWWKHFAAHTAQTPTKDFQEEIAGLNLPEGRFETSEIRGLNLARSSWVELKLLVRK